MQSRSRDLWTASSSSPSSIVVTVERNARLEISTVVAISLRTLRMFDHIYPLYCRKFEWCLLHGWCVLLPQRPPRPWNHSWWNSQSWADYSWTTVQWQRQDIFYWLLWCSPVSFILGTMRSLTCRRWTSNVSFPNPATTTLPLSTCQVSMNSSWIISVFMTIFSWKALWRGTLWMNKSSLRPVCIFYFVLMYIYLVVVLFEPFWSLLRIMVGVTVWLLPVYSICLEARVNCWYSTIRQVIKRMVVQICLGWFSVKCCLHTLPIVEL